MAKRSVEQWQALFVEQQHSGQTAAEFCRDRGLNEPYFCTRKKQLQGVAQTVIEAPFVRARVVSERAVNSSLTLIQCRVNLPNGVLLDCAVPLAHFKVWLGTLHG